MKIKIGFQGVIGAYSEAAGLSYFSDYDVEFITGNSFREVFELLKNDKVDKIVIPIENSLAGSIHENYDLMKEYKYHIIGEEILRVSHNLIAHKGVKLEDIKKVYSHPQALAQCDGFFLRHKEIKRIPFYDTAGSVKMISEKKDKTIAGIASKKSAADYKMEIIKEKIESDKTNFTRFLVLSKEKENMVLDNFLTYKTSLVFSLKSIPGALFKSISVFALRDIDMVKIESRPLVGSPWEYLFYVDIVGHKTEDRIKKAIDHLSEVADNITIFGSYKKFIDSYTE